MSYQIKTPMLKETTDILMKNLRLLADGEIDPTQANAVSVNCEVVRKTLETDLKLQLAIDSLRDAEDRAAHADLTARAHGRGRPKTIEGEKVGKVE